MKEIKAVKLSLDMWEWLYDNPLKSKHHYSKFYSLKINEMVAYCPLCAFYQFNRGLGLESCNSCPLKTDIGCSSGNYMQWERALHAKDTDLVKRTAWNIYSRILVRYQELRREEVKGFSEIKMIRITMNLWKWLSENPGLSKQTYPHFFTNSINGMKNSCPCCEYYVLGGVRHCDICPLGMGKSHEGRECGGELYDMWVKGRIHMNTKMSKKGAKGIYKILKKAYKKLVKQSKKEKR